MKRPLKECKDCKYAGQRPYWKGDYRKYPAISNHMVELVIERGCLGCLINLGNTNWTLGSAKKTMEKFDIGGPKEPGS